MFEDYYKQCELEFLTMAQKLAPGLEHEIRSALSSEGLPCAGHINLAPEQQDSVCIRGLMSSTNSSNDLKIWTSMNFTHLQEV